MKTYDTASLTGQNIGSQLTVQTWTATRDFLMSVRVVLSSLSASSGSRKMEVFIDGQVGGVTNSVNTTTTKGWVRITQIPVQSGEQIEVKLTGVAGDTSVTISSGIFGVDALSSLDVARPGSPVAGSPIDDAHRCRARLANNVTEVVDTRVLSVKDDDGTTELFSLTPSESNGVITLTSS